MRPQPPLFVNKDMWLGGTQEGSSSRFPKWRSLAFYFWTRIFSNVFEEYALELEEKEERENESESERERDTIAGGEERCEEVEDRSDEVKRRK